MDPNLNRFCRTGFEQICLLKNAFPISGLLMGCHPSALDRKSKVKPSTAQNGAAKSTFDSNKQNQRLGRTTSRPNDATTLDESVGATQTTTTNSNPNNNNNAEGDSDEELVEKQTFFGTDVSVEWLVRILCERFKREEQDLSTLQWILERLNKYTEKDLDHTRILRVTFGWDDEVLPRSVVLKISSKQLENEELAPDQKLAMRMFKKECNVYEWLQKQKKASVPKIYLIKKVPTDDCRESVIVMEDIAERATAVDWEDDISVEAVRDLLRLLAQIHAASRLQQSEWTPLIHANTVQFYKELADFIQTVATGWTEMGGEYRFDKLKELLSANYLARTVNNACKKVKCEPCLIHGNPISRNFFLTNRKEVAAIIDWTQVHPGCFGEDVTKAICWNLAPKERRSNVKKLLEFYHFSLLKYSEGTANDVTMETVEHAYKYFFPMASVTYLMFLPEDPQRADPRMLERAQALLDESLSIIRGLPPPTNEDAADEQENDEPKNKGVGQETPKETS